MERIASFFHHFCTEITIIGLSDLVKKKHRSVRILWAIFLLIGLALTILFLYNVVEDYQTNPTVTKFYYEINQTYQFPPTYIVADIQGNYPTIWQTLGLSSEGMEYVKTLLMFSPDIEANDTLYHLGKADLKKFAMEHKLKNTSDLYLTLLKEFQQRFEYNCTICDSTRDVFFWIDWLYFQIPFKPASPSSHIWYGIYATEILVHERTQYLFLSSGRPYHKSLFNEFFELDKNYFYEFLVDAKRIKRSNTRFRSCLEEIPIKTWCANDCFNSIIYNNCSNCTHSAFGDEPVFMDRYAGLESCSRLKHDVVGCFHSEQEKVTECFKNCVPLCDEIIYQYSTVRAIPYETDRIFLKFRLMFTDIGFQTLEEVQSYSLQSAISNVGGQLGLWLGLSAITIVQMLLFCLTRCLEFRSAQFQNSNDQRRVFHISEVNPRDSVQRSTVSQISEINPHGWNSVKRSMVSQRTLH